MSKRYRLRKNMEFNTVYRLGKNYWNRNLVLYVYENKSNGDDITRIGYTITKKIGNSVVRNKIRRRMKEICRLNFANIEKGYDLVFIPKKNVVDLSYDELEDAMFHIMGIAKIYNKGE